MENKYTTNYKDYMDFTGGEIEFYKDNEYYCSIKLLTLKEHLDEKYNELISFIYMRENELLEFSKKILPYIVVKSTKDFFIAFFEFYDKDKKFFNAFCELFQWMKKHKLGFGATDEIIDNETLLELFNHFLYLNTYRDKLEKSLRELTPAEKRQREMEERINKIKRNAEKNKSENGQSGFSYGKAILAILKEFPSMRIEDIMNLPLRGFTLLSKTAFGYSYHLAEIIAAGNGLLNKITHYTEEKRKNE